MKVEIQWHNPLKLNRTMKNGVDWCMAKPSPDGAPKCRLKPPANSISIVDSHVSEDG